MIGAYLNLLYINCKILVKTEDFDASASGRFFIAEVDKVISLNGYAHEQELINVLLDRPAKELSAFLEKHPLIKLFYLVNSMSEYNRSRLDLDELGRLNYESSIQKEYGITTNLVLDIIRTSVTTDPFLARQFKIVSHRSFFFLSHDIDSLYGSLLQDGLWALKHKRFDVLLRLFVNVLSAKPHWFNIDLIMKLESEYDFKSTFYWLVNKGKIDQRQTNSDYTIGSGKLRNTLGSVAKNGFENGLHKSISGESFKEELNKLPLKVRGNRFHYLKFNLPAAYDAIEESGLHMDASLGFAEHYGFRNNYGYPFSPYNFKTQAQYSFLEVPLTIMDGTFQRYMKIPVHNTAETIIHFLEKNKTDALVSVLWHNTFFTEYKYKGYKEEYIKILQYLYDEKFSNINQSGIIDAFSWKK